MCLGASLPGVALRRVERLAFGIVAAVLHFNRVPALIVAAACRWLAIPAQNFYDDIKLQALKGLEGGCWDAFNELVELMGWEFDEEKDFFFAEVGPFLGFIEDFSHMLVDQKVSLSTKASFHESLATSLQRARDSGRLYSGDCHSLQGKLLHQSNAYIGRVGRGQAFAFGEHAKSSTLQCRLLSSIM